jgi:hypothetical protein
MDTPALEKQLDASGLGFGYRSGRVVHGVLSLSQLVLQVLSSMLTAQGGEPRGQSNEEVERADLTFVTVGATLRRADSRTQATAQHVDVALVQVSQ